MSAHQFLDLFASFLYFSDTLCQPPYPTASQPGGKTDATRPAESHRLHSGFPHGRRRGVTEVDGPSPRQSGLESVPNLAYCWKKTWTCRTLCNTTHLVFCHLLETSAAVLHLTVHKLSYQRKTSIRTVMILPSVISSVRSQYDRSLDFEALGFELMPVHFLMT